MGENVLANKSEGNALFKQREYRKALDCYRKALSAVDDTDEELKYALLGNMCLAQYQLKDYEGALASVEKAISHFPARLKGYERKIRIQLAKGDTTGARETCKSAEENISEAKEEIQKLRAKIKPKALKGFLNKYPSLYAENPAGARSHSERMSTAGKRLLDKIKTLLGEGRKEDSALMNGLFHSLLKPEAFRRIVYKSADIPENPNMPRSFQELLDNKLYASGLEKLFPKIQQKANTVLRNVKEKGAKKGDYMDEATEAKLKPQVLNEAFAYEVVNLINTVSRLHGAAIARAQELIAPTDDERADYDQLGQLCVEQLADDEVGYGVQDSFLGDTDGEILEELRNDVKRMQNDGLFAPVEDVGTKPKEHEQRAEMAWITLRTAEKSYPAVHFLMEQLHGLPYELNKKFRELGKQLDLIGIPTNAKILLMQGTEEKDADEAEATLDGTSGPDDNGIKVSCVYHFNDWKDGDRGRLSLKPVSSDFQPIDPIADRLVVYRSREVINRIEPLSSTSSLRMTLAMYFNGIEKDGW